MIIILRSNTKFNSYARINYQINYLSKIITGNNIYKRINCEPCRFMNDSRVQTCAKNSQVLQAKDFTKPIPPCPPRTSSSIQSSQPPPPKSSTGKLLLALLLGGVGSGLLYYLLTQDDKDKEKKPTITSQPIGVRDPGSSADIPKNVPYLLIGGGTASFSAFRAIKSHDPTAKVLVISNEFHKPYMRPPLSKELWYNAEKYKNPDDDFHFKQWNGASRSLFYEPDEFYVSPTNLMQTVNGGVSVCLGYTVKKVLPYEQKAILSDGTEIKYEKCLIATGCTPKNLDIISSASQKVKEKVSIFRNPEDFICLKATADSVQSISIIGSGFLGSELACALSNYGKDRNLKVYQVFHENGNMAKVVPEYLSNWTTKNVEKQGVNVVPSVQITAIERIHDKLKLNLTNGKTIITDHVVVCAGCEANTDIAKLSGLEIHDKLGGYLVNAELEARKNLFVAGDAACFYDPLLGRRRVEHHDHSVVSGRLAGENMTGLKNPYKHQSMFWSDLGPQLGFEGIGLIDSQLPTVGVFAKMDPPKVPDERGAPPTEVALKNVSFQKDQQSSDENENSDNNDIVNISNSSNYESDEAAIIKSPSKLTPEDDYGRGVIFYLKDNKVVGILLWNIFNRIGLARQIINENKSYDDLNEVAKLFEIHS